MSEVMKLENGVKMYRNGLRAINGVSVSLSQGERVSVYGAPGSGKTTLARLIAGMEPVSSGSIFILGQAVHEMDEAAAARFRNQHIGILNRVPALMDSLTVLDQVALPLAIRGINHGTCVRFERASDTAFGAGSTDRLRCAGAHHAASGFAAG
jgi:putative ABC transport system ATP-binding protein